MMKKYVVYFFAGLFVLVALNMIFIDKDIGPGITGIVLAGGMVYYYHYRVNNPKPKKEEKPSKVVRVDLPPQPTFNRKATLCPACKSTNLQFVDNNKKGFSVGKAVAGGALLGGVGLLAGGFGKKAKKDRWHCRDCGNMFVTKAKR